MAIIPPRSRIYSPVYPHVGGRSSGVEHNLAKVGVVSSNLIARSIKNAGPLVRLFLWKDDQWFEHTK